MESVIIFGASGFIGQNLLKKLPNSFDVKAISLRNKSWKTTSKDSDIFINLVGKAHDHKGTATEADYFYANLDLAKEIFNEFIQSNAKLLIHISSLAAIEEFEAQFAKYSEQGVNSAGSRARKALMTAKKSINSLRKTILEEQKVKKAERKAAKSAVKETEAPTATVETTESAKKTGKKGKKAE